MLGAINRLFVRLQRRVQGIPRGSAQIYEHLATRVIKRMYVYVARSACSKIGFRDVVLDVGCGVGSLSMKLREFCGPQLVVGLDISRAMLRLAKKNFDKLGFRGNLDLVQGDAHAMPLRDKCFKMVLSTGTLHHIRRPDEVFRECGRVLKEGGEAWIYEFSFDAPEEAVRRTAKAFDKPAFLVKLVAALHGLPRSTYSSGYIAEALSKSEVEYSIEFEDMLTKVLIGPRRPVKTFT